MSMAVNGWTAADCGTYAIRCEVSLVVMEWTGTPLIATCPLVGFVRPAIVRSSVVLPAPLGPMMPTTCPAGHMRLTSLTSVLPRVTTVTARASMAVSPAVLGSRRALVTVVSGARRSRVLTLGIMACRA